MVNGIDAEKETLQSLVRSCLLELNKLKFDLTQLEVEKANDNSASRIRELEQDIVDKEKEVSVIKFKAEEEANQLRNQLNEKDLLIKNQEDRIYELDYVNNSLDEIKTYFAMRKISTNNKYILLDNSNFNSSVIISSFSTISSTTGRGTEVSLFNKNTIVTSNKIIIIKNEIIKT